MTLAVVAESGLRGRGGAGFPAADKWRAISAQAETTRYVVANGYEADPAAGTDRYLMEHRPFAVLEGALIAALTVGAGEVILAVRAESTRAVAALRAAVAASVNANLAGDDILGTGRSVAVSVRTVQGAYMLGEETVLLRALEGRRGQPEQRPPYPTEKGLFDKPTLVHNVATLAAVPWIITNGADAYRSIGDADAPGTVLVQVTGTVSSPGIAEIPTGLTISEIVRLAGGHAAGPAKAYLVGGPSGGLLPRELSQTPYTWAALREAGRPHGLGFDRRRRREHLRRRPRPPPRPVLRRRSVRQVDPLPDRPPPRRRDRSADRRRPRPADRCPTPRRPLRRHRRERPVRSRAPGRRPPHDRDAILPLRA